MTETVFPGEQLRARREELGVSVYEAFRSTRVPTRYIEALERGEIEVLPGECFTVGFVSSYCAFLGVDSAPYVDSFRACSRPAAVGFLRSPRGKRVEGLLPSSWLRNAAAWLVVLAIVALTWLTYAVIFQPQADITDTRVEAGVEMDVPSTLPEDAVDE